jgi:alkylhydroperoxidase/carboxymuconolactone decarboxylase family protein YurZ
MIYQESKSKPERKKNYTSKGKLTSSQRELVGIAVLPISQPEYQLLMYMSLSANSLRGLEN